MQYPRSILKKGSKVKSNHTNTFPAHDFLWFTIPNLQDQLEKGFCWQKRSGPDEKVWSKP